MNKKLFKYIIFIGVVFCFSILKVNAVDKDRYCRYGFGSGSDWTLKFTIDLDYTYQPINLGDSPLFTLPTSEGGFEIDIDNAEGGIRPNNDSGTNNFIGEVNDSAGRKEIFISANILRAKKCPAVINIAYTSIGFDYGNGNNIAIYDDIAEGTAQSFLGFKYDENHELIGENLKWSDYTHLAILEKHKDEDLSKYHSQNCGSYSSFMFDIQEAINKNEGCDNNAEFDQLYKELIQLCDDYRSTILYTSDEGTVAKGCQKACTYLKDTIDDMCQNDNVGGYCGSLGNGIVNWIFRIIRIIRYAMPALLIILSILDFIKAIAEEDESKVKEATKRFIRRLIAIVLLFVIPFILNFILNLFNIPGLNASNPFCAK